MDFFRTWIVPPLVGAVIGYFTNWLAIKMLFRPLKPVYLGRFRLPFTPGILPAERARLSESVGETVSTELLSADVFRSRLADESLRAKIEEAIASILGTFLDRPASPVLRSLGSGTAGSTTGSVGETAIEAGVPAVSDPARLLSASLERILASEEFRASLALASRKAAEELASAPLGDLLSVERFRSAVDAWIMSLGKEGPASRTDDLADRLAGLFGASADPLFSRRALEPIVELGSRTLYAAALPIIGKFLDSPELRAELEASGMGVVRAAIGRLTPVQRIIVGVASYEKTLQDSMPETVADLANSALLMLEKPETRERILASALAQLRAGREGKDGDREFLPRDQVRAALRGFISETAAEGGDFSERLGRKYETLAGRRIGDLVPGLPAALEGRTVDFLTPSPLGKAALGRGVAAFLSAYADSLEGLSVGQVLGIEGETMRLLAATLAGGVTRTLASQAERLVDALDVQSMVVDRLNALEMGEVERLILKVVDKELAWITILGGVLGGLIGIIQSLISLL